MKLHNKIILMFSIILIGVIGGLFFIIFNHMNDSLETQMGNNAMDVAVTVASMDEVAETLALTKDYQRVQDIIEGFRSKTRFQYIIVMDMDGIQYSYPYQSGVGKKYRNGGEERVLQNGESYVSADRNVLISAIRAFTPVEYNGKQVGAVLVGLLTETVNDETREQRKNMEWALGIGLVVGIIGAILLTYNIKKSIYGLEPKEIALLLTQHDLVLKNISKGIVALNSEGKVIHINPSAIEILGISGYNEGLELNDFPDGFVKEITIALEEEKAEYNKEIRLAPDKTILASYRIMKDSRGENLGIVVNFEDFSEVKKMAEALTGYKSLVGALRAQNHEFMNKLHTISGLIQLDEYEQAIDYIEEISENRSNFSGILKTQIKNSHVAAILLAKYNKLKEARIEMKVDSNSYLEPDLVGIREDEICSILGNLIDNAKDALIGKEGARVDIYIHSSEEVIELMVSDNGDGIKPEIYEKIFEAGFSTKADSRGYGLAIIKKLVDSLGATIEVENDNGARWKVIIPKTVYKG